MKSLQESLFDDNIKKNPTIREAYCLLAGRDGMQAGGMMVGELFDSNKLRKYPEPYYQDMLGSGLAGLVGVVVDLPVPDKSDYNKGIYSDWSQGAMKVLRKYIKKSWLHHFDEYFGVNVRKSVLGKDMMDIRLELNDPETGSTNGYYQFTFKLN